MVEFCPECGSLLMGKYCKCGYNSPKILRKNTNAPIKHIWNPPSANVVYSKLTGTPIEKLKLQINKGHYPEKLKVIRKNLNARKYTCCNCVYYNEERFHCQIKNKWFEKDSICKGFEPFEI